MSHALAVRNHGIPPECIDNVLSVNKEYYSLPVEEKIKVWTSILVTVVRVDNKLHTA
jgi:isopenicillin N synthase-like dioxygenase